MNFFSENNNLDSKLAAAEQDLADFAFIDLEEDQKQDESLPEVEPLSRTNKSTTITVKGYRQFQGFADMSLDQLTKFLLTARISTRDVKENDSKFRKKLVHSPEQVMKLRSIMRFATEYHNALLVHLEAVDAMAESALFQFVAASECCFQAICRMLSEKSCSDSILNEFYESWQKLQTLECNSKHEIRLGTDLLHTDGPNTVSVLEQAVGAERLVLCVKLDCRQSIMAALSDEARIFLPMCALLERPSVGSMLPHIPEDRHVDDDQFQHHLSEERDSVSAGEQREEIDLYGWSGPGTHLKSRKYQERNDRLKYKAYGKEVNTWFDPLLVPNATAGPAVPYEECLARWEPYSDIFTKRAESVLQLGDEMEELQSCDIGLAITLAKQVNLLADQLIADMKKTLVKLDIHDVGFVPMNMVELYDQQCVALHVQIFSCTRETRPAKEALMNEAIECANQGIRLCAFKKDPNAIATTNHLLHFRGSVFYEMKRYEDALVDFRGVCANIRGSSVRDISGPTLAEATHDAIYTMALIKYSNNAPRPHYTEKERKKIQREFGIGLYERSVYKCHDCGCRSGKFVMLSLCKDCKNVWFCSKECHDRSCRRKDEVGHKAECEYFREHGRGPTIRPEDMHGVFNSIAATGVAFLGGRAILIDNDTKELFDSITDEVFRTLSTNDEENK
eukprot:scaffold742_cov165-Amphora_coffeaeformis.AAC.7